MIYKLLKIVISIIIFPIIIILFSTAALFTTIIIQLIMDIPVDDINALVYTGKIFKEMLLGGTLAWICVSFMLFSGRKRLNRFAIVFLGLTFVALVAYKAIHKSMQVSLPAAFP